MRAIKTLPDARERARRRRACVPRVGDDAEPSPCLSSLRYRTPTAWLHAPDDGARGGARLALRATTAADPELGADSKAAVPRHRWCHLVFAFTNFTRERADAAAAAADADAGADATEDGTAREETKAWQYQLYVDGEHDLTIGCVCVCVCM